MGIFKERLFICIVKLNLDYSIVGVPLTVYSTMFLHHVQPDVNNRLKINASRQGRRFYSSLDGESLFVVKQLDSNV